MVFLKSLEAVILGMNINLSSIILSLKIPWFSKNYLGYKYIQCKVVGKNDFLLNCTMKINMEIHL